MFYLAYSMIQIEENFEWKFRQIKVIWKKDCFDDKFVKPKNLMTAVMTGNDNRHAIKINGIFSK